MDRFIGFLALLSMGTAFGQTFDAGVKAGVPATEFLETGTIGSVHGSAAYSSGTRRYTLGVTGEWHMTKTFGLELDAMYHRLGYGGTITAMGVDTFSTSVFNVSGGAWDFPLLAKYRFGRENIRPFVAAGETLRYIGPVHEVSVQTNMGLPLTVTNSIATDSPSDLNKRVYPGFTAAAGVEFSAGRFKVVPEVRYTRWTANISGPGGLLRITPDQLEINVAFEFGR